MEYILMHVINTIQKILQFFEIKKNYLKKKLVTKDDIMIIELTKINNFFLIEPINDKLLKNFLE